jgi:pimeloyl-ACP methyl ester carboxylesterase
VFIHAVLLVVLMLAMLPAQAHSAPPALVIASREPCPNSDFECITLRVPLDHVNTPAQTNKTINVVFGVLPARDEAKRRGMFVVVVGGPGASGLLSADSYVDSYSDELRDAFDIVFFDQRGIGQSNGFNCPHEVAAYYQTDGRAQTPAQERTITEAAQTFVEDCLKQLPPAVELPFYGTRQAVEDLEAFRILMNEDKLWLYGESYGTQFTQWYAAAHPDRVAELVIDGVVDLALDGPQYLRSSTQAFNDVLVQTLKACNRDPQCRRDAGGDALKAYDALAAQSNQSAVNIAFPLPNGKTAQREITLSDMETALSSYLYTEPERMLVQRAVAAAAQGNWVPMARLYYSALGLDPETLEAGVDPSYSDAAYYAVTCNDYEYFKGTPQQRVEQYLRAGDAVDEEVPRMNSVFYGDLPCAFWPRSDDVPQYDAGFATLIPTLVLNATADPATPFEQGMAVFERLSNAYAINTEGGPHVTFARGNACPDDIVYDFLVNDVMPAKAVTRCEGELVFAYVPVAPADVHDYKNALDAMIALENEIYNAPEFYNWDAMSDAAMGCDRGGSVAFSPDEKDDRIVRFTLDRCAFSQGFATTGVGSFDLDEDRWTLKVVVSGYQAGTLTYAREGDHYRVTGTLDGRPVNLRR